MLFYFNLSIVQLSASCQSLLKILKRYPEWFSERRKKTEVTIHQEGILMDEIGKDLVVK